MPPKKAAAAAKPVAPKAKAPIKSAAKAVPKKATSAASKAKLSEVKPVAGSKRKAADKVDEPKPETKKSKVTTAAPKTAVKSPTASKPAAKTTTKAAPKMAATKPTAKKVASTTEPSAPKATTKKAASAIISTKSTANNATATKRKADTDVEAPKAKKAKGSTITLAPLSKEQKDMSKKTQQEVAATEKAKKETEKKAAAEKKALTKAAPKKVVVPKPPKPARVLPVINEPPTTMLDIYVFGENSAGELGLGVGKDPNGKSVVDVKRPRINHNLFANDVGVVQIAVGGMHCVALTHDNKILTWGVNDQGALGRTTDSGPMRDISEDEEEEEEMDPEKANEKAQEDAGNALNASEATPAQVDPAHFPEGTNFAKVFAGDSISFALTTTGLVYGWGTFRGNDGILGFRVGDKQANAPTLIHELKEVVDMACGTNHVLALTKKGKVFTWGAGEQNQLARRVMARSLQNGLVPREFGMGRKKIVKVAAGDYHSFVMDDKGVKYAWGLNTFGQTGIEKRFPADDYVMQPAEIVNLKDYDIKQIVGGAHHSIACTEDNKVLIWGRCDNHESGMEIDSLPEDKVYFDADGKARYLEKPVELEMEGVSVATAGDTCLVVDKNGVAWSWGFSDNYQTGQGVDEDVEEAKEIDNTAVRGKKLVFGGLGGQFGLLAGEPIPEKDGKKVDENA